VAIWWVFARDVYRTTGVLRGSARWPTQWDTAAVEAAVSHFCWTA